MTKPCIICNNNDSVVIQIEDRLPVVKCRNCGLVYPDFRDSEEIKAQAQKWEDLYSRLGMNRFDGYASRKILYKKFLKSKKGRRLLNGKKRVLDIGCGEGFFLSLLSRVGMKEIYGVDKSENAIQFLRRRYGFNAFAGELHDANYQDDFFDLITLWDVLEHIPNPRFTLAEIRRILKKEGVLFIRVPNARYLLFKYFICGRILKKEKCFIPKVHYYNFSPKNLTKILKEEGFKHIDMRPGMPEIYGTFVRRFLHCILYAMSLLIFTVVRRIPFTCFMVDALVLR